MANITGVNVAGTIVPFTTDDAYATHDDQYGKGGYRTVATVTARDAIPAARRTAGMAVYCRDVDFLYILQDDLTTWTDYQALAVNKTAMTVACSDETTALTTGVKVTTRAPYAFTLTSVRASLTTAQTAGSILTIDVKVGGSSIFSTLLTVDNGEKTSYTAATAAVISTSAISIDDEIKVEITQLGDGTAAGLKVHLIGTYTGFL